MAGNGRASKPQVWPGDLTIFAASEIGLESTLKWRHGFKSRWDYPFGRSRSPYLQFFSSRGGTRTHNLRIKESGQDVQVRAL
jgi:hypothetical protein